MSARCDRDRRCVLWRDVSARVPDDACAARARAADASVRPARLRLQSAQLERVLHGAEEARVAERSSKRRQWQRQAAQSRRGRALEDPTASAISSHSIHRGSHLRASSAGRTSRGHSFANKRAHSLLVGTCYEQRSATRLLSMYSPSRCRAAELHIITCTCCLDLLTLACLISCLHLHACPTTCLNLRGWLFMLACTC